ncbi:MAG: DNA replication/repair protein RecF [Oscillospiraceae bacterium]|nr:DNA replication/repair protein RecF [Oscillospiraceae bacterium]
MELRKLTLRGFRNYEEAEITLCPGVNLFQGDNAQGKTNLLEAVRCLSAGKSFRTRKEKEMIGFDREFADLRATFFSYGREKELRTVLYADRRRKELYLSGVKQRTGKNIAGELTTVLFLPSDLQILSGGASARRGMIDDALCQLSPGYAAALARYERVIEQKNRVLRDRFEDPSLKALLPDYNEQLCRCGAELIRARAEYLAAFNAAAEDFHAAFSGGRERLKLCYHTVSTVSEPTASVQELYDRLREHLTAHWQNELDSCQCLSGPHRDDLEALVNDRPIKLYGSQGQLRTAAISLKLAEREVFRQQTGELPVLLLDDVLSELDLTRQDFVLNRLTEGQVLITCCEPDRLTDVGSIFLVDAGTVRAAEQEE